VLPLEGSDLPAARFTEFQFPAEGFEEGAGAVGQVVMGAGEPAFDVGSLQKLLQGFPALRDAAIAEGFHECVGIESSDSSTYGFDKVHGRYLQ
jgi:hypothetical protein